MKWIFKPICLVMGHNHDLSKPNYNPHTKLFSYTCSRCGGKHFEKDEE